MRFQDRKTDVSAVVCRGHFVFIPVILGIVVLLSASKSSASSDFAPIFTYDNKLELKKKNCEFRALGPIVEWSYNEKDKHNLKAVRPLWSLYTEPEYYAMDFVWPLFVMRETKYEKYWRFFLLYRGHHKNDESEELTQGHIGFIPLWFSGYDKKDEFYWGFFPLYGDVHDFLRYDSIKFYVFPLWLTTERGSESGWTVLWPLINYDSGPRFEKFRFFPFYAYHDRPGQFRRTTYLWPLFHQAEYLFPNMSGETWMLWPLIGHNTHGELHSWSFIWPLFCVYNMGEKGFGLNAPWPIIQYRNQVDEARIEQWRFYFWPLAGVSEKSDPDIQFRTVKKFFLWPLGETLETKSEAGLIYWFYFLPLYWSKDSWNPENKKIEEYKRFWPLASWFKNADSCEVRFLDFFPERNMPVIDRNWNPLWTLYSYEENKEGYRYDFFWGLVGSSRSSTYGKRISIMPFYHVEYDFPEKENPPENAEEIETVRYIFFGSVKITTLKNQQTKWRLLWFLEL